MTFEAALEDELKTISALNNRVYPHVSPKQKFDTRSPYLIYITSEGQRTKTMDGYITGKSVSGEINVIAPDYTDMKTITQSVIELMTDKEQNTIGEDGPFIQQFSYEEPTERWEDEPKLWRCLIDFEVYF